MRLLADSCVAGSVVMTLRSAGFDVEWVADWEQDPGDSSILHYAHKNGRVLITRDKDFGALIFRDKQPHNGVLRVPGSMTYKEQAEVVLQTVRLHAEALERCCLVTIETDGVRVTEEPSRH